MTRAQAFHCGLTPDSIKARLRTGRWDRVHRGVYAIAGVPPTWHGSILAACLRCGPQAVASHRAACRLWRLPGGERAGPELIVPRSYAGALSGLTVHRIGPLASIDRDLVDGVPVTSPARTLLDLTSVVPRRVASEAIDDALRRQLVTLPRLRWELARPARKGRRGIATFRALTDERSPADARADSALESRLHRVLRQARFEGLVLQHPVRLGEATVYVDFAFPEARVAIEGDSYRWHGGRGRWQSDLRRRSALAARGWLVLHFTAWDIDEHPDDVVDAIRRALASRARA